MPLTLPEFPWLDATYDDGHSFYCWWSAFRLLALERCVPLWPDLGVPESLSRHASEIVVIMQRFFTGDRTAPGWTSPYPRGQTGSRLPLRQTNPILAQTFDRIDILTGAATAQALYRWAVRHFGDEHEQQIWWHWSVIFGRIATDLFRQMRPDVPLPWWAPGELGRDLKVPWYSAGPQYVPARGRIVPPVELPDTVRGRLNEIIWRNEQPSEAPRLRALLDRQQALPWSAFERYAIQVDDEEQRTPLVSECMFNLISMLGPTLSKASAHRIWTELYLALGAEWMAVVTKWGARIRNDPHQMVSAAGLLPNPDLT